MQLSVFSTDSQKSGFRLQYLQILNWGTFDKDIYTIRPDGETSLLTGANASGKTTIVDALLTLIVPEKKYRFYNQSSGTKKKDARTEESYVLGGFGHTNSEETGTTKTQYLRPDRDQAYSILLLNFANEEEQTVTLLQVRHFVGGELKKFFAISHKALTIEEDLTPFDLSSGWKKALDIKYNKGARRQVEWFDSASNYAKRLVECLGLRSTQALELFNHTVGIKVLDNLDQFIRANMLEPRNIEDEYQDLKGQLRTLLEARTNMEKAEAQIGLLTPLVAHHEKATELKAEIESLKVSLETIAVWKGFTQHGLLKQAVIASEDELRSIAEAVKEQDRIIEDLLSDERDIQNQIDGNKAGQRLNELEAKLKEQKMLLERAKASASQFKLWTMTAGLEMPEPFNATTYNQLKRDASFKQKSVEAEKQANAQEAFEATAARNAAHGEMVALEQQLNSMQQSRNNLDYKMTALRKQICADLKIDTVELPFAAELMRVREDESAWEPALEKLLSGFSRRLLVPDKHYKKVTKYVNSNDLRARLVYEHVNHVALNQHASPDTVPDKLEFHPDHELSEWLEQTIIQRFSFECLFDEKGIERYDKAITKAGLIRDGRRHEKDDRVARNDASNYVMGWDNERKKEVLRFQWSKQKDIVNKNDEIITRCRNREQRFTNQYYALKQLHDHAGFAELDHAANQRAVDKILEQITQLQRSNQELNTLAHQLETVQQRRRTASEDKDSLTSSRGAINERISRLTSSLSILEPLVAHLQEEDKDRLLEFQQSNAATLGETTLENIEDKYRSLSGEIAQDLEQRKSKLESVEREILKQINNIKNPIKLIAKFPDWLADVQYLPTDPAYVIEYKEWLDKLSTENLPKYRREFENFINTTITHKVAGLKETLDSWEREIEHHVEKLNESLAGINFNRLPDTYIQLGKRKMPAGTDVRSFRQQLLEALPQVANWQQDSFEAKAAHFNEKVQPLIDQLDDPDYRRRVLDVRNWFEFWADEFYRADGMQKKTFRQMGQLSGGEKAQLTYTILCSAIAYQFGITREGKVSRSLRFIAVDESFSNQDEEKSTYLMELCRELHLQLLVVTPSDKIHIVQDFIAHVHLAQRVNNRNSTLYNMTVKELKEEMSERKGARAAALN